MLNIFLIIAGKFFSSLLKLLSLGNGSTWPGHVALGLNKRFVSEVLDKSDLRIILVAGTNGKTTTSRLIRIVLEDAGLKVIQNESGANLLNGIASCILVNSDLSGRLKADFLILEVDENILPLVLEMVEPDFVLVMNLFRDQLDRYGEVNSIAGKWKDALGKLGSKTTFVLNSDDPQVANLGNSVSGKVWYFGLSEFGKVVSYEHAADTIHCPKCGKRLIFKGIAFSHLGDWKCEGCGLKRPKPDVDEIGNYTLQGTYNKYNLLAAALVLKRLGIKEKQITGSFKNFRPAFGRQEVVEFMGKKVQIFLSKNPTGFNQSYSTISQAGARNILLVLNDRIPDGRDVSWIWDIDFPGIEKFENILISGDRAYDMALRIRYEEKFQIQKDKFQTFENLNEAVGEGVRLTGDNETLFILPTYSAMLEVRKILTGKKIL